LSVRILSESSRIKLAKIRKGKIVALLRVGMKNQAVTVEEGRKDPERQRRRDEKPAHVQRSITLDTSVEIRKPWKVGIMPFKCSPCAIYRLDGCDFATTLPELFVAMCSNRRIES
jgi:hypothetical protein